MEARARLTHKNPKLYEHVKKYVCAAINLIARSHGTKYPYDDWSGAPEFPFIFSRNELRQLPEYKACLEILRDDEVIGPQLNVMVGINSRRSRSDEPEELMVRIPHLGVYRNRIKFNEEYFEREYASFEGAFYNEDFNYEVIAPLQGPVFTVSVNLNDDVQICRLNRYDLSSLTKEDIDEDILFGKPLWAIKTQYQLSKIVGDGIPIDFERAKEDQATWNQANEIIDQVLACLRLLGVSNVYPTTVLHRTRSWLLHDSREYSPRYLPTVQSSMELDEHFPKMLKELWKNLQNPVMHQYQHLAQAIKRFRYAHERHDWEDKIVDLLIAAEALFLSEIQERSELSYRLKLNAAIFLGGDSAARKAIFDDMGNAYILRSKIVHGDETRKTIKKIKEREAVGFGEEFKLDQFIYRIQEYIRVSIRKMINAALEKKGGGPLVDWNSLLLGIPEHELSDNSH